REREPPLVLPRSKEEVRMLTLVRRGCSNDRQVRLRGIRDHDESSGLRGLGRDAVQIDFLILRSHRQQRLAGCCETVVLQQNNGAGLSSLSLTHKIFVAGDLSRLGLIHIGLFKETKFELLQKNTARRFPDARVRDRSVVNLLHDDIRLFRSPNLIYARVDRLGKTLRLGQFFDSPRHADILRSGLDPGGRTIAASLGAVVGNRPVTYNDAAKSILRSK